ncbi:M13-type metalloendopeptidase, partial [Mycoplasmopsis bovis]
MHHYYQKRDLFHEQLQLQCHHIVFPAGILNKPFYSIEQSEATNYGG